jgi:uncharacterized protein with HEPN domain
VSNEFRDGDYLQHVVDAGLKIARFIDSKSIDEFEVDELLQDGVIRNLEVIGEAVTKLSNDFKLLHSHIPWSAIAGMRNRLIHAYMTVNLELVWDTATTFVPDLLLQIQAIRRTLES